MVRLLPLLVLLVPPALADLSSDLDALCASHSGVDLNSDGAAEVESLSLLPELVRESADAPLALVLVEERLLQMPTEGPDLLPHLGTYVDDLATEGLVTDFHHVIHLRPFHPAGDDDRAGDS